MFKLCGPPQKNPKIPSYGPGFKMDALDDLICLWLNLPSNIFLYHMHN